MPQLNDNINANKGKHLNSEERIKIEAYKELGYLNRNIAGLLERVSEIINNAVKQGTVRTMKQHYERIGDQVTDLFKTITSDNDSEFAVFMNCLSIN